jgi:hypothetical protein
VLYTADDVLADLEGRSVEVGHADRVARVVHQEDEHGGESDATAWDCLVRVVRR